jgi:hypothetical protein
MSRCQDGGIPVVAVLTASESGIGVSMTSREHVAGAAWDWVVAALETVAAVTSCAQAFEVWLCL